MFNPKIKVDVIIPNFNKGAYLEKAIKSVINQTYKKWNLYIIDDNSTDKSKKILDNYKNKKNIKVFFLKKNYGPSYCRNLGMKNSKSKYIAFLDSDDYWKKNKLKSQLKFILKNNFPFTFTDYKPIFQYKNYIKKLKDTNIANFFDFEKFIKNSSINTSTMIIERKYVRNIKFKNIKLMEDYIFKCELMKKTNIEFKKHSASTAIYRIIKNSRSSQKFQNIYKLWQINKNYNKLSFLKNLSSIFFISLNSWKKYGLK